MEDKEEKKAEKENIEKLKKYEASVRTRVECEETAFCVVNKLIDGVVEDSYLMQCGQLITTEHYSDIIEERAISFICGYPLCDKPLANIPKKKYHISTRSNKVFEISERKNFCSNQCLRASKHFQNQISESPLWARAKERPVKFELLTKSNKGAVGDEVISINPRTVLQDELTKLKLMPEAKTSFSKPEQKTQTKITLKETREVSKLSSIELKSTKNMNSVQATSQGSCHDIEKVALEKVKKDTLTTQFEQLTVCTDYSQTCSKSNKNSAMIEANNTIEKNAYNISLGTESKLKNNSSQENYDGINAYSKISGTTGEPYSGKTQSKPTVCSGDASHDSKMQKLHHLMAKRKNLLSGMADVQTLVVSPLDTESSSSGKGNQQTSLEENEPSSSVEAKDQSTIQKTCVDEKKKIQKKTKKSAPALKLSVLSYIRNILKRWITPITVEYLKCTEQITKTSDLPGFSDPRVQVGYADLCSRLGAREREMDIVMKETVEAGSGKDAGQSRTQGKLPNYDVLKEEADKFQLVVTEFITGKRTKDRIKEEGPDTQDVYIPTVDKFDQQHIRIKIVLDKLDKSLGELLSALSLTVQDVSVQLRELIYTFRFEKDTIVFRPFEWTLVAMFILKMLSQKHTSISSAFDQPLAIRFYTTLLEGIGHSKKDLDDCVKELISSPHEDLR